jgi:hypothetical protein
VTEDGRQKQKSGIRLSAVILFETTNDRGQDVKPCYGCHAELFSFSGIRVAEQLCRLSRPSDKQCAVTDRAMEA